MQFLEAVSRTPRGAATVNCLGTLWRFLDDGLKFFPRPLAHAISSHEHIALSSVFLADSNSRGKISQPQARRGGRVVDGSGLENRQGASPRGFESHPLRHSSPALWQQPFRREKCAHDSEN